ncbi:MAG: hypothetical protein LBU70_04880 [Chitinispirillales bacterium]|jgi:alpha/beta superfamily hydrolase|nr:hypothetical protein [Chitinispirillales bacterium]
MSKTIVFGGWAVSPDVLKNVFGDDAIYIDINRIMPKLFDGDQLKNDWTNIAATEYLLTNENIPSTIAGWSTGAFFAYTAAREYHPERLILFSATPSFCRKDDFHMGTRPSVIDQMIGALRDDKDTVLRSFYKRSGLCYDSSAVPNYTTAELICGLMFLKQACLLPLAPLPIRPIFYHGTEDQIIPISASRYFSEQTNGERTDIDGGHAFFIDREVDIR